jgi:hypothetical protein
MHRLMVLSRTYQLASNDSPNPQSAIRNPQLLDPSNDLLGRAHRRRLDAESIRDTLLSLGGNLDPTVGGAHPFPPQPQWDFTQHKPFKAVYDTNRRSVYLMTQRIQRHPLMAIFDGPDTSASTASRTTSTTTLQALYFLNDQFVHEQATRLAARVYSVRSDEEGRIRLAYELLFARPPTDDESKAGRHYLTKLSSASADAPFDQSERAWESFLRVLFRTNEFVYVD